MERKYIIFGMLAILSLLMLGCANSSPESNKDALSGNAVFSTAIKNYEYTPGLVQVNEGDAVTITIKNDDPIGHGIFLDNYNIKEFVNPSQTKTIKFTAKKGSSSTFCSTDHGEKLIVDVK